MPYCPKCKAEYREGFTKCADCEVDLVDELPPEPVKVRDDLRDNPEIKSIENEVVLETFEDNIEFSYVASMLDEMNIPYRVRTKGGYSVKGLYTHSARIEKTIYIDDKDFDMAEEVLQSLDAYLMEDYDEDIEEDIDEDEEEYEE